jgi:phage-related protein
MLYAAMADKPLAWLHGEVKSPPFSREARIEAGYYLRKLQQGERLAMPISRRMPSIGPNCHELRIEDAGVTWRILYYVGGDAIAILEVFGKKTKKTPKHVTEAAKKRLKQFLQVTKDE